MNQIVIEGVLRKNTRGRSHLVFRRSDGRAAVVRLAGDAAAPSGSTITVTGIWKGNVLAISRMLVRHFPRRAPRSAA